MRIRIVFMLLFTIVLSFHIAVYATDLPIDINAIGHQEGYDDAVTTRFNIDLFSVDTQKVNDAIAAQARHRKETAEAELFKTAYTRPTVDTFEQITGMASDVMLFAQPVNFNNLNKPKDASLIPVWLMLLLFTVCAAGGFVWALVSGTRKRRREAGVH